MRGLTPMPLPTSGARSPPPMPDMKAAPGSTILLASAVLALLAASAGAQSGATAGSACAAPAATPSAGPPPHALATFDTAWTAIHTLHFDTTFNGVDWQAVRSELRPRAGAAATVDELRRVLRDMVARLGQSHFSIIPAEASREDPDAGGNGDPGIRTRWVGDDAIVFEVAPGSSAHRAGVGTGWTITSIDGCEIATLTRGVRAAMAPRAARFRASRMVDARLRGQEGSTTRVGFVDDRGARRDLALEREAPRGDVVRFGGLPPMRISLDTRRLDPGTASSIGYIGFDGWFPVLAARIDSAVHAYRGTNGIIIDLRGNGGGVGGMVMGIAGHFLPTQDTLGTMKMRGQEVHFVANPRRVTARGERVEPLTAPLAILVDEASASTSEIFAGAMQALGRARVFGDTTAGAALPAVTKELPNGDVLYHAIADFTIPGGTRLEGRGVIPDEVAPLTRADLLAGRDPALDAAVRWLTSRPRP